MSFDTQIRIFAVSPAALTPASVAGLSAVFAADAQDGAQTVRTLCCGWDDEAHTRLRALSFGSTFAPLPLADGRVAVAGLWSLALLAALESGELGFAAEELTVEQLAALRPVTE